MNISKNHPSTQNPDLMTMRNKPFENIEKTKGKNSGNKHFLLFPKRFIGPY